MAWLGAGSRTSVVAHGAAPVGGNPVGASVTLVPSVVALSMALARSCPARSCRRSGRVTDNRRLVGEWSRMGRHLRVEHGAPYVFSDQYGLGMEYTGDIERLIQSASPIDTDDLTNPDISSPAWPRVDRRPGLVRLPPGQPCSGGEAGEMSSQNGWVKTDPIRRSSSRCSALSRARMRSPSSVNDTRTARASVG